MESQREDLRFVTVEGLVAYGEAMARRTPPEGVTFPLSPPETSNRAGRAREAVPKIRAFVDRAQQGFPDADAYRTARQALINEGCGGDLIVFFAAWNAVLAEEGLAPLLRGVLPIAPLMCDADRRALKQIALNLISNALKFTPTGGSVTVTVQASGDVLEIVVADTGVGIAQDDLDRLGRPFEQAGDAEQRAAGSGLGLSLVRAFARLHNGEMTVESSVGEGTSVTIRLPVLSPAAADVIARRQG